MKFRRPHIDTHDRLCYGRAKIGNQRPIVINGSPHLRPNVRQWWGDSRGHWEESTLVVDVTNVNSKVDFFGSRGTMHVKKRYVRTGPDTIQYVVTMEDAKAWTRPWTVREDLTRQSVREDRIYTEPRCHEGNYGLPGCFGERGWRRRRLLKDTGRITRRYVKAGAMAWGRMPSQSQTTSSPEVSSSCDGRKLNHRA
jgi:hypothetical protein